MNKELYEYLQSEWLKCNHKKYHHLFNKWVGNLTDNQIKSMKEQWLDKIDWLK